MDRRVWLLAFAIVATSASAQQYGSVGGAVRDESGAVVPGVKVTVSGASLLTPRNQLTGSQGAYSFSEIPPGRCAVAFEISGFKTLVRDGIVVEAGKNTPLEVVLQVTQVAETVTVTGESPMLDLKSATAATNVDRDFLREVPNGRDVWVVLEHTPGLVLDRFNVGGSESGQQSLFSAVGTSWTQNQYHINGVNTTDPQALGASALYYSYDSFEEIQVSVSGHSVEVQSPGVFLNLVTKRGGNHFKGGGALYYENETLQSDNLSDALRARGVPQSNPLKVYYDWSLEAGGPVIKDKASFYAHVSEQNIERYVIGFFLPTGEPGTDRTDLENQLVRGTFQLKDGHQLGGLYFRDRKLKPNRDASRARPTPETTFYQDSTTQIVQATYSGRLSSRTLVDGRFSLMDMNFPLGQQPDLPANAYSRLELSTGILSGGPGRNTLFERQRFQVNGSLSHFKELFWGGAHDIKLGGEVNVNPVRTTENRNGSIVYRDFLGMPLEVELYSDPVTVRDTVESLGLFAQDNVSWGKLTLNLGVRFDRFTAGYPDQKKAPGPWDSIFQARGLPTSIPGREGIVKLNALSPRLGVTYALSRSGRTVLRANYSRYAMQLGTGIANFANPNGTSVAVYSFTDRNRNRILDPGEIELDSPLFLTTPARNQIDPDLAFPHSNELTIGLEREVASNFSVGARFIYRRDRRLIDDKNIGVVDSDFTPVTARDPGPDLVPGTADDRALTVYDQSLSSLGRDAFLLANPQGLDGDYRGVWLEARKRFSGKWQMLSSITIGKAEGYLPGPGGEENEGSNFTSVLFDNPNANLNTRGRTFWDRTFVFRLAGSYLAFRGITFGAAVRTQSGQPRYRSILVSQTAGGRPLNQGAIEVIADPQGSERIPAILVVDLRAEKEFEFSKWGKLGVLFDLFNAGNANRSTDIGNRRSLYGAIFEVLPPRVARIGVRYSF